MKTYEQLLPKFSNEPGLVYRDMFVYPNNSMYRGQMKKKDEASKKMLAENKSGILLYLRQEGRGIGLVNKIRAYALQDQGHDTVEANELLGFPADLREYNICLDIMQHFNITSVNLLTNNPKKVDALEEVGIKVVKRTSLHEGANDKNQNYLDTKRDKMGHLR